MTAPRPLPPERPEEMNGCGYFIFGVLVAIILLVCVPLLSIVFAILKWWLGGLLLFAAIAVIVGLLVDERY